METIVANIFLAVGAIGSVVAAVFIFYFVQMLIGLMGAQINYKLFDINPNRPKFIHFVVGNVVLVMALYLLNLLGDKLQIILGL